ncbi:MAG: cation-translocating P-type ATPase [Nitrosomonadales bacterium]|jgi:Cu2+-exporting ATPase|nr:cation-translocating P-type ATPase [Nitrosomonadales bacterium]MBT4571417.1 cation-translocating P-type ATPase [Nitrosomonadales bacterium]MBT5573250.1 cation-translocating P-type ATPase [Nitrosomonadales bacterium]MBT6251082.1 cation-translocating P-type ATPase [Nitrosomonadales bacterium]MBT6602433.1 cation-translocating P-type ATPase [Nitrosomonadales bacterium]
MSWSFLKNTSDLSEFCENLNNDNWRVELIIEGIHCMSCVSRIENSLHKIKGLNKVNVHLTSNHTIIEWNNNLVKLPMLVEIIHKLGFKAFLSGGDKQLISEQLKSKQMLWNWSVSLICFFQIMMFSMPSYLSGENGLDHNLKSLFDWGSFILIIPVIIFSGKIFFHNAYSGLKNKAINMDLPISLGIILMFLFSVMGTINPSNLFNGKVYYDSISMFIFLLLSSRYLDHKIKTKSWITFTNFFKKLPESSRKVKNKNFKKPRISIVGLNQIRVGDLIQVLPGETINFDGVIVHGSSHLNNMFMTGESTPEAVRIGNYLFAGGINIDGVIYYKVERLRNTSYISKIKKIIEDSQYTKPAFVKMIDKFAQPFLLAIIFLSICSYVIWSPINQQMAINAMISVLIVTCPCALYLSTPIAMSAAANKLAKKGIYIRNLSAFESLAKINLLFLDKTGTLTDSNPSIAQSYLSHSYNHSLIKKIIFQITKDSLHPFSNSLKEKFGDKSNEVELSDLKEISGKGIEAFSETYGKLKLGSAIFCGIDSNEFPSHVNLCQVHLTFDGQWVASFSFKEMLRKKVKEIVASFSRSSIESIILSGDQKDAVIDVAKRVGIKKFFWAMTPKKKHQKIIDAQKNRARVMMVGDGFNDGPALAQSDVSVAMGASPSIVQTKSDFIIISNDIYLIKFLISFSKKTLTVIRQNICWALFYNLVMIPFAFFGYIEPWIAGLGMTFSSCIVAINSYRLNQ